MNFKNKISNLLLIVALSFIGSNVAMSQNSKPLTIHVIGFQSQEGKVMMQIYRKGDDVMGKPFIVESKVVTTENIFIFKDLPYGNYVAFAIHDINGNGKMDHSWYGMPQEPMGYSNDWHFSLLSGMPSYEKTKFSFTKSNSKIEIVVE